MSADSLRPLGAPPLTKEERATIAEHGIRLDPIHRPSALLVAQMANVLLRRYEATVVALEAGRETCSLHNQRAPR